MSELVKIHDCRTAMRWNLLTSASGLALIAYISSVPAVKADDAGKPSLWIELGGQMETMQGTSSPFTAPFMSTPPSPDFYDQGFFISDQQPPRHTFGLEGKITFQPKDSDWLFTVGARYGRSVSNKHTHHQTRGQMTRGAIYYTSGGASIPLSSFPPTLYQHAEAFSDLNAKIRQQHLILDFSVGRDVGIGIFGRDSTSTFGGGLRAVEFSQNSNVTIYARPAVTFENRKYPLPLYRAGAVFNEYSLTGFSTRSFHGMGPSLTWTASAGLLGNTDRGELFLDWGVNVAMLFGRQKAETGHGTTAMRYSFGNFSKGANYTRSILLATPIMSARVL